LAKTFALHCEILKEDMQFHSWCCYVRTVIRCSEHGNDVTTVVIGYSEHRKPWYNRYDWLLRLWEIIYNSFGRQCNYGKLGYTKWTQCTKYWSSSRYYLRFRNITKM